MISWIRREERKVCITHERFSKLQFDVSGKSSIYLSLALAAYWLINCVVFAWSDVVCPIHVAFL